MSSNEKDNQYIADFLRMSGLQYNEETLAQLKKERPFAYQILVDLEDQYQQSQRERAAQALNDKKLHKVAALKAWFRKMLWPVKRR
ncbi:MAG: hypothetical protein HYS21_13170 [Deltaproteobacteria bacterium]|nr:hypothetical protein [Deltaproteobacteria bacterium]